MIPNEERPTRQLGTTPDGAAVNLPPGFDPDDAPEGYRAVQDEPSAGGCALCDLKELKLLCESKDARCMVYDRKDKTSAHFKRKEVTPLDPDDSPLGFYAAPALRPRDCEGCQVREGSGSCHDANCIPDSRADGRDVIHKRREVEEASGVDPDEAPEGFCAHPITAKSFESSCTGCDLDGPAGCALTYVGCCPSSRHDGCDVIFKRKEPSSEKAGAPAATEPAPEEQKTSMPSAGLKFDLGKPRLELLDRFALEQTALVLNFGANKYAAWNWAGGIQYSLLIGAALRHIEAYNDGEDLDPESGLPHTAHAMCCLMFLLGMSKRHPEMDDRYKPEAKCKNCGSQGFEPRDGGAYCAFCRGEA